MACDRLVHLRGDGLGARQGDAAVSGGVLGKPQVLAVQAEAETTKAGLRILRRVNSDGLSEMLEDKFTAFTPDEYARWLRYHLYLCEKPEHLGACNHWLFVCEGE